MKTEMILDVGALMRLESAWWRLWRRMPNATPFVSPAWLLPWWMAFGPGALHGVAVWDDGRLVALAPLYLENGPQGRRLRPLGMSLSDYTDVLIDPDVAEAGAALLDALDACSASWDRWSAEELAPEAALLGLDPPRRWRFRTEAQSACPVLALPGDVAEIGKTIPSRRLRKWRMAQNRAARRGWHIETADAVRLDAGLDALFRLHGARWRTRGEAGVLAEEAVRRFHRQAAPALLAAGLLRLNLLHIDGVVAGVFYGLHHAGHAYGYLGGFDPGFAFESPGTILLGAAIERAASGGARAFHFLRGQEPYKYEWGAADRWNVRRIFEPRS